MIALLLNLLLAAWLWIALGDPFFDDALVFEPASRSIDSYKVFAHAMLVIFLFGVINFRLISFEHYAHVRQIFRYAILPPLVWLTICLAAYVGIAPNHANIVAHTTEKVLKIQGYAPTQKQELLVHRDNPYALSMLPSFRYTRMDFAKK